MATIMKGDFVLALFVIAVTLVRIPSTGAQKGFKLSEMKRVGDHCDLPPGVEEGSCNFVPEPTKSCQNNRCSCLEEFMEVELLGHLECVVPDGKPCLRSFWLSNLLLTKDKFKMTIMNFTEPEQIRELAIYDAFQEHIHAGKNYFYNKTPKDMSCASGKCGEKDICAPVVSKIFNQTVATYRSVDSSLGTGAILAIVFGVLVLIICLFCASRFLINSCRRPMGYGSPIRGRRY